MHFIEVPKLEENSDEKDMLVAWTEFLKNPESEKVRSLEMTIDKIRQAKDQLVRMSNDTEQREIYDMRAKILKDKVSALNKAKEEGKIEMAIEMLKYGDPIGKIVRYSKLSEKEIGVILG